MNKFIKFENDIKNCFEVFGINKIKNKKYSNIEHQHQKSEYQKFHVQSWELHFKRFIKQITRKNVSLKLGTLKFLHTSKIQSKLQKTEK